MCVVCVCVVLQIDKSLNLKRLEKVRRKGEQFPRHSSPMWACVFIVLDRVPWCVPRVCELVRRRIDPLLLGLRWNREWFCSLCSATRGRHAIGIVAVGKTVFERIAYTANRNTNCVHSWHPSGLVYVAFKYVRQVASTRLAVADTLSSAVMVYIYKLNSELTYVAPRTGWRPKLSSRVLNSHNLSSVPNDQKHQITPVRMNI